MNGLGLLALTVAVFLVVATVGLAASLRDQRSNPAAADNRRQHAEDTKRWADQARHHAQTGGGL